VESNLLLKLGLVSFWGTWFLLVFCTNFFEACKVLHVLPCTWKFSSHNFQPVHLATTEYHAPLWVPKLLFSGILLWQLLIIMLYGWAIFSCVTTRSLIWGPVNSAFTGGLCLWGAFMLADEFFKEYDTERSHVLFFSAQLITLIALHVLPS
jgi:hypothetical protein